LVGFDGLLTEFVAFTWDLNLLAITFAPFHFGISAFSLGLGLSRLA